MTDERKALYWLSACGVPADKLNRLLEIYGNALEVFDAFPTEKLREYVGAYAYDALRKKHGETVLDRELCALRADNVRVLLRGGTEYPDLLERSGTEPPAVLYAKGNVGLLNERALCMVGTRRCTAYGKRVATEWAAALSSKFVIVSGHATGIDTYAVKSCLASGGRAIVVLACGLDAFDPPDFMRKCPPENLLLVTEYPYGSHTMKYTYQERNRLLSGLSAATVIVEASEKSGALITANWACRQNRTVFAVPADVFSERSRGVMSLLRHGAVCATSVADIFEDLSVGYDLPTENALPDMTEEEKTVYDFLSDGARHFDEIAGRLALPPQETSSLLSVMELEGIIEKRMQNHYALLK